MNINFKIGDKVRILDCGGKDSDHIGIVGYVYDTWGSGKYPEVGESRFSSMNNGNICSAKLVEVITSSPTKDVNKTMLKTYRLLKETISLKAGAILQSAYDDGAKGYKVITKDLEKYPDIRMSLLNSEAVEKQPDWFEEIVEIAYLSKDEEVVKKNKTVTRTYVLSGKYAKEKKLLERKRSNSKRIDDYWDDNKLKINK